MMKSSLNMRFDCLTLFPEFFELAQIGLTGKAFTELGHTLNVHSLREFSDKSHGHVDDAPFGGGPGMVLRPEVMMKALRSIPSTATSRVIHFSPKGSLLTHNKIQSLLSYDHLILIASRYEGVDERALELGVDEEISVGDFVVSGGELPALILIDAVARWLPGVLGNQLSAYQDSFVQGLLDHPHYTRPEVFEGCSVPEVLVSGDHEKIRRWRLEMAMRDTQLKRPDLWASYLRDRIHTQDLPTQWLAWGIEHPEAKATPMPKGWKGWPLI
ncbi:MAG: tRNA (guanosine(37)-N1)-methyltransferase TrmD [Holophagaceae bacterium]|jgi:tRNA (guanine37-N1)-methyltransferase